MVYAWYIRGMKRRLSSSIDEHLLDAAEAAVRDGHAPSMSALVEEALKRQLQHTKRLEAWGEYMEAFNAEFGATSDEERDRLVREFKAGIRTADEILAERRGRAA